MAEPTPDKDPPLHEQRDWLRVTLACIGDAVITTNADGQVTFLNHVAESLTGWSLSEAVGCSLDTVIRLRNEDTREVVETPSVRALTEGRTATLAKHSLLIAKDGSERSISDSAALIRNDQGDVAGVVVVFRDISERRVSERALENALQYADGIIATLREPFVVLDADLRVKTANSSFYRSFNVTKEDTENHFVYDLGNGQWDIGVLREMLDDVLTHKHPINDFEIEHDFPSIGRKIILVNASPFPRNSKHPELILLALQDISESRERAKELAEVSRNKDEFLATLAHELRNPLAPLRSAALYLGMGGWKRSDVKAVSDLMTRQVAIMVRLIDDLLDMSRISRNTLDIRKEDVSLAAVLQDAVEGSRSVVEQFGHELSVSLPPDSLRLHADPIRLTQIFLNLLNNAAKYTNRGGHIWLDAWQEGSDAVVSVRDNGTGIPSDMLDRIFDMFIQVDRSLERSEGGLGIGLTLVRRLVDMHDGSISVRSDGPGQGSEFSVRLPCLQLPTQTPVTSGNAKVATIVGRRILIVDDNKDSAGMLEKLLRLRGNSTRTAHDGLEAIEAAQAFLPQVVLLDIGLPKLNGYEVTRQIRQQVWGRDMILIALTGWDQDEDRRRSREVGFDFHMVKPVDLLELERLLNGSQSEMP